MEISPVYRIDLVRKIEEKLLNKYSYDEVEQYISLWQIDYDNFNSNFYIFRKDDDPIYSEKIDLLKTLSYIAKSNADLLLKIAIDLGIETPDFIPLIPTFRNRIKTNYKNASTSFEKAFQNIEKDPQEAVGKANSVLESIIKEILSDDRFSKISTLNATSGKLVKQILKVFQLNPDSPELPDEMKSIGSSLTTVAKAIEDLRSDKTLHHGQESIKYLIDQPLYAYFVINACATVGLFLIDFYENKFPQQQLEISDSDLPF
ncbi:Abortive infection C-terminus [Streptococcus gallolyticus]|uniref:Abortive infection C-terminus n=1 Tax=Streptococcus gallolyticus TaxID=315405 RepID=A0A1H7VTB3_9STRE|nr:abortive infection family protein [Streptococcus gallolyticus]SEF21243.1 Abortive infection C-terminus [Streptococcus gallolyticus]SEM12047.1 Abortive infection C-terminus [Streptococcus gallolyticus]